MLQRIETILLVVPEQQIWVWPDCCMGLSLKHLCTRQRWGGCITDHLVTSPPPSIITHHIIRYSSTILFYFKIQILSFSLLQFSINCSSCLFYLSIWSSTHNSIIQFIYWFYWSFKPVFVIDWCETWATCQMSVPTSAIQIIHSLPTLCFKIVPVPQLGYFAAFEPVSSKAATDNIIKEIIAIQPSTKIRKTHSKNKKKVINNLMPGIEKHI